MDDLTYIYCRPRVLETPVGCIEVVAALASLALALGIEGDGFLREADSNSVTVPGIGPAQTWRAMDRVLDRPGQRHLFFCPDV